MISADQDSAASELHAVNRIIKPLDGLQMLLLCLIQICLFPHVVLRSKCCAAVSWVLRSLSAASFPLLLCLYAFTLSAHFIRWQGILANMHTHTHKHDFWWNCSVSSISISFQKQIRMKWTQSTFRRPRPYLYTYLTLSINEALFYLACKIPDDSEKCHNSAKLAHSNVLFYSTNYQKPSNTQSL